MSKIASNEATGNLAKLQAAYNATTPGVWEAQTYTCATAGDPENGLSIYVGDDSFGSFIFGGGWPDAELTANANFTALAHNAMPSLMGAVEALQEIAKRAREAVESDGSVFLSEADILTLADNALDGSAMTTEQSSPTPLLEAAESLKLAIKALNTAPRFKIPSLGIDSYQLVSQLEGVSSKLGA